MKIIIAHSNDMYVQRLKSFLVNLEINEVPVFMNGFEALSHIIKHHPKMVVIEEKLPGLNARDIRQILIFKRIKTQLMVINLESIFDANIK